MAENEIRIKDLPSTQQINETDDVIVLDNATDGTRKLQGKVLLDMIHSAMAKGTASGAVATFTDGADNIPMTALNVAITPKQDLHGYDSPWVGGGGKNKFNIATISVKEYIGENGNLYSSNNWSVSDFISVDSETAYVLSGITNSGSLAKHAFYDSNKVFISAIDSTVMNFTTPSNAKYIRLSLQSETPTNVQLEKGTTATTFAPYSNICPISGHTEANVVVSPTTSAEDGNTYNIQFKDGDNPLTVYGGTLDVLSGVLTVDRKTYTLTGSESWRALGTGFGTGTGLSDIGTFDQNKNIAICSHFTKYNTYNWNISNGYFNIADKFIAIRDDTNFDSVEDCVSYVTAQYNNNTPITICAKLATPQTYQLTPTEVKSLLGVNNIWADTGNVLNAEYVRDTTTIINEILARLDALES